MYFTFPTLRAHLTRCFTFDGGPYTAATPPILPQGDGLLLPMPAKPPVKGKSLRLVCPVEIAVRKRMFEVEVNPELHKLGAVSYQRHYDSGWTGHVEITLHPDTETVDLTKVAYLAKMYVCNVVVNH